VSIIACAALALGLLLSATIAPHASAINNYLPGLRAGDSAYYSLSGSYGFNQSVTKMRVSDVSGTTRVIASFTGFFPDSYTQSEVFWVDVFSGQSYNSTSNFFFAVATGLQSNDPIFEPSSIKITAGPGPLTCGGASRQLVYSQFARSGQSVTIFWDQKTGAMCSYSVIDGRGTLRLSMVNTTLWSNTPLTDPFTTAAEISAALGAPLVVLIVLVYFRKKRARLRAR
jgi:hypothetical protein